MTGKNAATVAARKKDGPRRPQRSKATLCASCAPMYGYEPVHKEGISLGGQCFGCRGHHEILGMFTVPNPAGGFASKPLTEADLRKRRIVDEEDSFDAFDEEGEDGF